MRALRAANHLENAVPKAIRESFRRIRQIVVCGL